MSLSFLLLLDLGAPGKEASLSQEADTQLKVPKRLTMSCPLVLWPD